MSKKFIRCVALSIKANKLHIRLKRLLIVPIFSNNLNVSSFFGIGESVRH